MIAVSGLLMFYLGEGYARWRDLVRSPWLDACEGGGALLFALAGLFAYLIGHGLVKGALFMLVGVLLATRASVDELELCGLGREGIRPAGIAMAPAALLLGGAPLGVLHAGAALVSAAAPEGAAPVLSAAILVGTALTGAAVLRATGRIFLGLGPDPGEEATAPTDEEQEAADRPLWLMLRPAAALLAAAALPPAGAAGALAARLVPGFDLLPGPVRLPEPTAWNLVEPWAALLGTAGFALFRHRLPRSIPAAADRLSDPVLRPLARPHSGLVGDYVAFIALGFGLFAAAAAL